MTRRAVVVLTALIATGGSDSARHRPERSPCGPHDRQSFSSATTAILVDVVVRDRKGRPVTDMNAAEFSLYEDGTPQKIDTFTRVTRGGGIGVDVKWKQPGSTVAILPAGSVPPPLPGRGRRQPGDDCPGVRSLVGRGAWAGAEGDARVRADVRRIRRARGRVRHRSRDARDAVATPPTGRRSGGPSARSCRPAARPPIRRPSGGTKSWSAAASFKASSSPWLRRRPPAAAWRPTARGWGWRRPNSGCSRWNARMIDGFDTLDRDHKGYDTTLALMRVIRSLAETPGRKSIVFFSEGLPVSPVLSARFDDLIDAANRSNVTVYAVDANGLRTSSSSTETRKQLQEFTDDRMMQNISGGSGGDQPMTRGVERVEDMVRLDSRTGLARLAEDTGGFLVEESNNLTRGLQADRRGQPVPLPADVRPTQHGVRREVPRDRGEVEPLRRAGLRAQGLSRRPRATRPSIAAASKCRRLRCSTGRRCRMPFPSGAPGLQLPRPAPSGSDAPAWSG